ncbi:unnamed protein product, partial [Effrenium voratum]
RGIRLEACHAMLSRLDQGFEPYLRLLQRSIEVCSPRKESPDPFPSPGGFVRLADETPSASPLLPVNKSDEELPTPRYRNLRKVCQVFGYTSLWWCAAILVILEIKSVLQDVFPYPFALTAMVQPTTAFCAYSLAKMVMIGCVQGFEIGLTNKALEPAPKYLSVAARTMISSMNVLFMMCTARLWGLERLGFLRFLSSLLMICGGLAQCQPGSESTSQWGFFFQLISMLLSSQRWAMAQKVLQSPEGSALRRTSKLQLLARTLPITGAICMVLALIFEPGALGFLSATAAPVLAQNVLIVAVGLTAMLYAELKLA